jgi:hypothetical protein
MKIEKNIEEKEKNLLEMYQRTRNKIKVSKVKNKSGTD